jgi:hypothetical protein
MSYISEEEENMEFTCPYCEDVKVKVHGKHHDNGTIDFVSDWGDYIVHTQKTSTR